MWYILQKGVRIFRGWLANSSIPVLLEREVSQSPPAGSLQTLAPVPTGCWHLTSTDWAEGNFLQHFTQSCLGNARGEFKEYWLEACVNTEGAVQVAELPSGGPGAESAFPKHGSLSPRFCQHSLPCFSQISKRKKQFQWWVFVSAAHLDYSKLSTVPHRQFCQESSGSGKTVGPKEAELGSVKDIYLHPYLLTAFPAI